MTVQRSFSEAGFSIAMYRPTIEVGKSYTPDGGLLGTISNQVSSWTHEIRAEGGYWSADFSIEGNIHDIDDWLAGGMGRHIEMYDETQTKVWEGFVNEISINMGSLVISRGPLMAVGNRVENYYTPIIDPDTDPPLTGDTMPTPIVEELQSQGRWGIIEKILSSGQLIDDDAEQIAALYLAENHDPKTQKDYTIGSAGSGNTTITVHCLGYVAWLEGYAYNDPTLSTTTVSAKMQDVLAADPNGMFSTNYGGIASNGTLVTAFEDSSRTAWTIIKEMLTLGGGSDDRWIFGIYADLQAYYAAIPTAYAYYLSVADASQRVFLYGAFHPTEVRPWRIMPGRWLYYSDLLIGREFNTTLGIDPRGQFIESVTFTAPADVKLAGSQIGRLSQKLARLGLGGV